MGIKSDLLAMAQLAAASSIATENNHQAMWGRSYKRKSAFSNGENPPGHHKAKKAKRRASKAGRKAAR